MWISGRHFLVATPVALAPVTVSGRGATDERSRAGVIPERDQLIQDPALLPPGHGLVLPRRFSWPEAMAQATKQMSMLSKPLRGCLRYTVSWASIFVHVNRPAGTKRKESRTRFVGRLAYTEKGTELFAPLFDAEDVHLPPSHCGQTRLHCKQINANLA